MENDLWYFFNGFKKLRKNFSHFKTMIEPQSARSHSQRGEAHEDHEEKVMIIKQIFKCLCLRFLRLRVSYMLISELYESV